MLLWAINFIASVFFGEMLLEIDISFLLLVIAGLCFL